MIVRTLVRELRHADLSFGQATAEIPPNSSISSTWAGVFVNEDQALRLLTVWSCVSLITDIITTMPIGSFRDRGAARIRTTDPSWLEEPLDGMDRVEWLGRVLASDLLRGNGYARIVERDRLGFARQMLPLHPDEVKPTRRIDGRAVYKVAGEDVEPFDMIHIKGLTLAGKHHLEGLSPVGYAAQTIGTALAAEEYGARFFSEGAQPAGVLASDQKIDDDVAKAMQARWLEAHGNRHRKPAVLGGGLKWESISLKPEEAQFLDTIKAKHTQIAGMYRVPPHLISDVERSTSWGTGIEEQNLQFLTFTLGPWIVRLERALSKLLPRPQYVKFNLAALLRARLSERFRAYLMGRQGGWLSIDDVRALEEMSPLPDGKGTDYLQPLNYAPIPADGEPVRDGQSDRAEQLMLQLGERFGAELNGSRS